MKHFITSLFNLEEKDIFDIEVFSVDQESFIFVTLRRKESICPACKTPSSKIHDYRQATIRHPILSEKQTTLIYNQRRYVCPNCSKKFAESNPFAAPGRRISNLVILRVMKVLKNPGITSDMAAKGAGISTTMVQRIFDTHAGIKAVPFPQILCIDEVYAVKYQQRIYACVLVDFVTRQIFDLLPDRKKYHLAEYFSKIDRETRMKVRYISMDMWDTYRDVCSLYFPNAKICVDSFHVVKLVNCAFSQVRIRVMKSFSSSSDEYYLLKKFHRLLNKDYSDIPAWKTVTVYRDISFLHTRYQHATSLVNTMLSLDPELEIAYMLKDTYLQLNKKSTSDNISERLNRFLEDIYTFNIPEFNSIGRTIRKWRQEIINSFDTYDGRRISNGPIESVNARIKLIKRNANGYKNFDRFRKRVLYSLNSNSTIKF